MSEVPKISRLTLWFFRRIVRGYFRRHFRAVRIAEPARLASLTSGPVIVYANHSSWWDPMVQNLLAAQLLPRRQHFAPMDADALERYAIFKRLGVFGVEMKTPRGAARFLRTSLAILNAGGIVWITPQGRFADPRERPLAFKSGLAALAARVPGGCTVLPLAIEYPFWDERLPETLLHFGQPVFVHGETTEALTPILENALLDTMHSLQTLAIARDPTAFELLHRGQVGTGGFYGLGQRLWAWLRRKPFRPEHTVLPALPVASAREGPR